MKKLIFLLTFFVLTNFVNAQTTITFKDLTDKTVKSTIDMTVSDNSIDFKNIVRPEGYWVKFTGDYLKRFTIKNLVNGEIIIEGSISANTDNKTFQIADCRDVVLNLTKLKITGGGNSSGVCGQLIYIYGKWKNITVLGGSLNQIGKSGGASFQTESYSDPTFSHGKLVIDGTVVLDAMGEGFYNLYNQPIKAYLDTLIVRNTNVKNSRRDFWQHANVRYSLYENNTGDNGGLERNADHISGFSLNNGNNYVKLVGNRVTNIPQFIYSGTTTGKLETLNNVYIQGTSAFIANQSIYTKSQTLLQGDSIIAPKVLIAAIAQDKAQVTYTGLTVKAPKLFRYTTPVPIELPAVKNEPVQAILQTTTVNGIVVKKLIYEGQEFLLN